MLSISFSFHPLPTTNICVITWSREVLDEVWFVYTQWRKSTAGSVSQRVRPWIWSGAVPQIIILLDKTCEYSRLRPN
ncbi:hypothetical protein T03_16504 [Trichinella britovi]|uniref:Uncharacterized protein n=1 Tax=Trichinella britovi TaxID=45882 RepID=A0A0V1AIU3_TRIBR|nr:hypothetical protein T03_16504 [Trichinella britovi]